MGHRPRGRALGSQAWICLKKIGEKGTHFVLTKSSFSNKDDHEWGLNPPFFRQSRVWVSSEPEDLAPISGQKNHGESSDIYDQL